MQYNSGMTNEKDWVEKRLAEWQRLEVLTRQSNSSRRLKGAELVEMMGLYRKASADLATVRGTSANPELTHWLNGVVARAYSQLYQTPRLGFWTVMRRSLWRGADTVRRRKRSIYLATTLFFFFCFAAIFMTSIFPQTREVMVPPMAESSFDAWKSGSHEARSGGESIMASVFYGSHNPRVAIVYNALSVATCGIFGIAALWMNGALFGILAKEVAEHGHLGFLLSSVAPHGVSELGGIFISVGAGFLLAGAVIRPGRLSRFEAIKRAGQDAAVLMILSLAMIFIAAPIEGFFSFNPAVPQWVKVVFAVLHFAAWGAYFSGYGRSGPPEGASASDLRPEPLDGDPEF